jgi:hypothetical protein
MAMLVELSNGRIWKTKTAAKQHFRDILARYNDNDVITDFGDHCDLCALLERFDILVTDGASKIGPGIKQFERRLNKGDGWSSPGFWVVRTDGTATDFSFPKAVDGNPKSLPQEFYDACHNAISLDLLHMKQRQFDHFANAEGEIECDVTGQFVAYAAANLNHANPPFVAIVNEFRRLKGWELGFPPSILTVSQDAQLSTHFTDDALAQEFRDYHHSIAVLRIVSRSRPAGIAGVSVTVRRPLRFK